MGYDEGMWVELLEENSQTQGRLPLQPRQEDSGGGYADGVLQEIEK